MIDIGHGKCTWNINRVKAVTFVTVPETCDRHADEVKNVLNENVRVRPCTFASKIKKCVRSS